MTLDQLYYFRKLAELQHYTKSANELYISQPSLSSSMRNLEKELGASLFQKNGRNVTLTSYGKEFYNCVTAVLKRLDDGIATLKHSIDSTPEKVAIAAPPIYPGNLIAKSIRSFKEAYPKTNIDVFTCIENQKIINGISDGEYDLGICFKADKEQDLVFVPILKQELVVIAKKGHELSRKEKLLLSDLQGYPLITYRENNPLGTFIRRLFKEQNIDPDIAFTFDEDITIVRWYRRILVWESLIISRLCEIICLLCL